MFEELNTMIAYTKRLEFEIKRCLDTPYKMFKIIRQAVNHKPNQALKDLFNDAD